MSTRLVALHGFTMNGAGLRHMLLELERRLAGVVELACPDAPHVASADSVAGLASLMGGFRAKPPNLEWWNASDDGHTYHGWQASRDTVRAELERPPLAAGTRLGLLGFSQGAAVAAVLAALAERGAFPRLSFVVLVAGFLPRAHDLEPLFEPPIQVPSLHVWGDADRFARHSPPLLERFSAETRQVLRWPGPHAIPSQGGEGDALVEFVRRHASGEPAATTASG
jgi:predicted esterase